MKRSITFVVMVLAASCLSSTRGKAPFVNERSLMRGARCQVFYPGDNSGPHEDVFGEVSSVQITKTADTKEFVIQFSDFDHCTLSFWTEAKEIGKSGTVRSISSY